MSYNNPYRAYQKTQITTAKPEKILLLLYEGAIRFIRIANTRMKEKNIAEKGKYISKTIAIISELMNTLDHKVGGQLAADLENLYMFMIDKLIEGNIQNNSASLDDVERLLTTLYQAWQDVVNNPRPDGVPSPNLQPDLDAMLQKAQQPKEPEAPKQAAAGAPRQNVVAPISPLRMTGGPRKP